MPVSRETIPVSFTVRSDGIISVIIRTLNEERHLDQLLTAISAQALPETLDVEVVVVDSGSTDSTLQICARHNCRMVYIQKKEFSFGRSLNLGCAAARGVFLVFVSGHCIPQDERWLANLVAPLRTRRRIRYTYGRQLGGDTTKFSEHQIFNKYFPNESRIPQEGFFCNNANAALTAQTWDKYRFDESLTGLEDMELAKRLLEDRLEVAYVADASVFHLHDESPQQVRLRFEREAIALQRIMPEIHISFLDFARFLITSISVDLRQALARRGLMRNFREILVYRTMQFWGAYVGNHSHRKLSRQRKEQYFYPTRRDR